MWEGFACLVWTGPEIWAFKCKKNPEEVKRERCERKVLIHVTTDGAWYWEMIVCVHAYMLPMKHRACGLTEVTVPWILYFHWLSITLVTMSHLHIEFTCISNEAPVQTNPFLKHKTLFYFNGTKDMLKMSLICFCVRVHTNL